MRALVVEDEAALREGLREQLVKQGFSVDVAADGEEGLFAGNEYPLDIAVIDLGLPKLSGLELIRKLRAAGKTFPILILTARDRWQDKVEGLQAGADDYVSKPYHFEEVLARMQALMRRAGGWASPILECGPIKLDTRAQAVTLNGAPIELTTFEYRILEHMMLRAGDVISKTELTERLYDQDYERDSNVIEVFIGRLRRKLDPDETLRPIETLRGRGYRFSIARSPVAKSVSGSPAVSRPSLRRRLMLSVFVVLVVFFGLTVFLLDMFFRHAAEHSLREVLDAQMIALIAAADPDGPESVTPTATLETRLQTPGSGLYAEIRSASGETIWRSPSTIGTTVQFGAPLEPGERRFAYTQIAGTPIRLAVASRSIVWDDLHGAPARFTFSVASSLEAYQAQVANFRRQLVGWFAGLALLFVATLGLLISWLGQPMRRLELEIKEVEAGKRQSLSDAWPEELTAVTSNLNGLLEGERSRIRRYRDTLGNLAHSLKTPLAVMRQSLGTAGDGARNAALNAEIDRMNGIIEHQMKRAAASGGVLLGQAPVDVAPVVVELRVALLKVYGNKDLLFENAIAPATQFIGDRADLTELLGNLLDNACKWARERVRIEGKVDAHGDSRRALTIVIEDDGKGIAEEDRARVLTRGGRADEATPGYGLGLAMVRDTVDLYGGSLRIDGSTFGGARFELKLPGRAG